ncbi:MAG: AgmX/PglI C-terminal domain-containing protein [Deltaproteobacteria bacterium]|nr:AgmX/PglI C-terminal domain-containing protein [Deltaproteobacteria bacterium]
MQRRVIRRRLSTVALVALAGCAGSAVPDPTAPAPSGEDPLAAAELLAGVPPSTGTAPADPGGTELSAHSGPAAADPPAETPAVADPPAATPEPEPAAEAAPPPAPIVPGDGELDIGRGEVARAGGRVNGGIFQRQVERKRSAMLTCYNVALGSDPALQGDLIVVLVIDTQGMVGAEVEEDDEALAAAGVTSCVVGKLRQVSFSDTPPSSELRVRVPLHFEP